ncbi:hypothetical protein IWQ61_004073 [Dispira simplex]|nr:hypothetical protein IWQ61_004073 [Dispira simplex]
MSFANRALDMGTNVDKWLEMLSTAEPNPGDLDAIKESVQQSIIALDREIWEITQEESRFTHVALTEEILALQRDVAIKHAAIIECQKGLTFIEQQMEEVEHLNRNCLMSQPSPSS